MKEASTSSSSFEIRNKPIFPSEAWKQLESLPEELRHPVKRFLEEKLTGKAPIEGVIVMELMEKKDDAIVKVSFSQIDHEEHEIELELHLARSGEWKVLDYQWDQWYGGDDTDDGSDMEDTGK